MTILNRPDAYHRGAMIAALALSVWIFVSPWFFGDMIAGPIAWNFFAVGALGVTLSLLALMRSDDLAEYGLLALGAWFAVSPWVLGASQMGTRQSVFYAVILMIAAWLGRPSFKPKSASA